MRVIRFADADSSPVLAALTDEDEAYPLPFADLIALVAAASARGIEPHVLIRQEFKRGTPIEPLLIQAKLLVPIVAPEVWAAGVTYEKSRQARDYEATGGRMDTTTIYDRVYEAQRPEIFFKSTAARTVGPNDPLDLRTDSNWQIPEPELGLVLDRTGRILGYTIGNDMSARDIEGENPLYLPQAKIWRNSCSIGPAIRLAESVSEPYALDIVCRIYRGDRKVVEERANTRQLKRRFDELIGYLIRDNTIFDGTVLLTGTCAVPPNDFTLQHGDRIEIEIPGIGVLVNPVRRNGARH